MQIKNLQLKDYRNYEDLDIEFAEGVNIIYGENAQGKTNILESIYMCATGKSHKHNKDKEIIRWGNEEGHIKAEFTGEMGAWRVDIHLRAGRGKGLALNRVPLKRVSELYGKIYVVIFSAEDLDIIKRGPQDRRNFCDNELCQIDPIYVEDLINYNKILNQRRELLKKMDEPGANYRELSDTLDIWDEQLVNFGSRIISRRREFIEELNRIIFDIHYEISSGAEKLRLVYEPSVTEDDFYKQMQKNREKDRILKQTSVGPHRDDFSFYDQDIDLKTFGSNGQQRTCALSLKMAEIKLIEEQKKEKPILLLDDVLSELDRGRQKQLLKSLGQTQTIITCTGVDEFVELELKEAKKFHIDKAKVI